MANSGQHCAFVLLAEFDIDRGAQLTYQFPQPLGTDEGLLANLMLPDGAEKQLEDWTIFFLNQTSFNTIAPVLALESPDPKELNGLADDGPELLYVLNLVRTKHDKTVRRGAVVKAMAICTRHPFIQIFKPVLLMALDDYFTNPSQDCLARLFDAVNAMDISAAPTLTRCEKLIMRTSERKDVFAEKFAERRIPMDIRQTLIQHSNESRSSIEGKSRSRTDSLTSQHSASEASFSLGGSAVWVGDESGLENGREREHHSPPRGRISTDASSASSHGVNGRREESTATATSYTEAQLRSVVKDTHFYQTSIAYKGHTLPIRMPLSTFPEEVGDYSLIQLIQIFSAPGATVAGPQHPHLHTNGSMTHPIILLFNALVTGKRIIFLGYQRPAGQVSSYVLAACALGSGCGAVLRGFIARAFPYANLTNRDEWESIPGFIAGVTNPIFESAGSWDLLCDVGTGRMTVHKDIYVSWPPVQQPQASTISRAGASRLDSAMSSEDDIGRTPALPRDAPIQGSKSDFVAKADNADNIFIEDVISAISYHFGEPLVRARFMEYVSRFVRLAARYEEEIMGSTKIAYPNSPFMDGPNGYTQLGSGMMFLDEVAGAKELAANANRIEGWRRTTMYEYYLADFQTALSAKAIQGFDLSHQLWRLRNAKTMSDAEAEAILRAIAEGVQTYEQVVELLASLPPHQGGLLPLTFGLFHQQEQVRDVTVELLTVLRAFPVGVQFLQTLNHFHRYAYVRQAHAREARLFREHNNQLYPPSSKNSRTPSNQSESSFGG
ncbi:spindle pole body interacting protein [Rickenella mellea]|uniref:Spindle pole body interacting protein n=1 Tax=Rickenella mellea TaxID=50990 RepID=A0A4Y7PTI4_9AGAM|nr:spindle pole body interacting protein [Rickenella mellea]